jgi:hypothetical protein
MDKKELNRILKNECGVQNVTVQTNEFGGWGRKSKCLTDFNNKRMKGIPAGSRGPLTCTNQWDQSKNVEERLVEKLWRSHDDVLKYDAENGALTFTVKVGEGRIRTLKFVPTMLSTYTLSCNLDPDYRTQWYVLEVKDSKVKN